MTTALDTSILLDVLTEDSEHGPSSTRSIEKARRRGPLVISPVVWAEIRAFFSDDESMDRALEEADVRYDEFDRQIADLAGGYWRSYRKRGGTRKRILADFLIGAHAVRRGGRLLTRDRGFFRRYFRGLEVIVPG